MPGWHRKSDNGFLDRLARKARRRGDAAEAVLWYRALAIRQAAQERAHLAAERRWRFNNPKDKLERMEHELKVLRAYYDQHTDHVIRQRAEEKAAKTSSP
jgi:hypothetical protein